jgi:GLPGLI family protein
MMKIYTFLAFLFITLQTIAQPKIISECTVVYELSVQETKADPEFVNSLKGSVKTLYIKGSKSRSDLISSNYTLTTFFDSKTDTTVVLRELGKAKYMSYLSPQKKEEQNRKFEDISFTKTGETKTILGYECTKVVAKLKDGSSYNVYYANTIIPSNLDYEFQFKNIPGFVLEYETESEDGKTKIIYTATKITLTPVPAAKFELPKTGYRIL